MKCVQVITDGPAAGAPAGLLHATPQLHAAGQREGGRATLLPAHPRLHHTHHQHTAQHQVWLIFIGFLL